MGMLFSLQRKSESVVLEFPDGAKTYTIRELSGKERDIYTSMLSGKMRFDQNGKPAGMKDFAGLQIGLLELALVDEEGKPVKKGTIESWPSSAIEGLFKKAQQLSALTSATADEAGNG